MYSIFRIEYPSITICHSDNRILDGNDLEFRYFHTHQHPDPKTLEQIFNWFTERVIRKTRRRAKLQKFKNTTQIIKILLKHANVPRIATWVLTRNLTFEELHELMVDRLLWTLDDCQLWYRTNDERVHFVKVPKEFDNAKLLQLLEIDHLVMIYLIQKFVEDCTLSKKYSFFMKVTFELVSRNDEMHQC